MHHTKILFLFILLSSLTKGYSQTIDKLIENAYNLDAIAQYQLGMLFYGVSLEPESHPKKENLMAYYEANYAAYPKQALDSLDIQLYEEWLHDR